MRRLCSSCLVIEVRLYSCGDGVRRVLLLKGDCIRPRLDRGALATTKVSSQDQGSRRKGRSQLAKAETRSSRVKKAVKRALKPLRSWERRLSLGRDWLYCASTMVHAKLCARGRAQAASKQERSKQAILTPKMMRAMIL